MKKMAILGLSFSLMFGVTEPSFAQESSATVSQLYQKSRDSLHLNNKILYFPKVQEKKLNLNTKSILKATEIVKRNKELFRNKELLARYQNLVKTLNKRKK